MVQEINFLLFGWRGFLVGTRRAWHAHQRPQLGGFRGDSVVASPGGQLQGVKRLTATVEEVFARGGLVWSFGLGGGHPRVTPWGRLYPVWRPGTLSNHFQVRLRKTNLLHRLGRTLTPPPRRGRRRGSRLTVRWGRLRRGGFLPLGVHPPGLLRKVFRHAGVSTRGVALAAPTGGLGSFHRAPQEGYLRGGHLRRWGGVTPEVNLSLGGKFNPPLTGGWNPRGGNYFAGVLTRVVRRRTTRVENSTSLGRTRGVHLPPVGFTPPTPPNPPPGRGVFRKRHRRTWTPVGVSRFQRWPHPFPSLLVGGGSTPVGATLTNEATSCGVFLVRLEGSEAPPGGVLWNQDPRSLTGVVSLVDYLWGRSFRVSLLRTLWGRLSLVPPGWSVLRVRL